MRLAASLRARTGGCRLRLALVRPDCLLGVCHGASSAGEGDGPDTRHATTTESWRERCLLSAVQYLFGLDAANAERLIGFGAVYLQDERAIDASMPVGPSARLRIHLKPRLYEMPPHLGVVACTEEFVICFKPSGVPIHPTLDNLPQNLLTAMSRQLRLSLLPTSRLDVETSGLVLLARSRAFQSHFNEQLQRRAVHKEYLALVFVPPASGRGGDGDGVPSATLRPGILRHWMERRARAPMRLSAEPREGWLLCESEIIHARCLPAFVRDSDDGPVAPPSITAGDIDVVEGDRRCGAGGREHEVGTARAGLVVAEVRLRLRTGRTHQLRAQLAQIGHPVVGDTMYGSPPLHSLRGAALGQRGSGGGGMDTATPVTMGSMAPPVAWLPQVPFALHCARLCFGCSGEGGCRAEHSSHDLRHTDTLASDDERRCRADMCMHTYEAGPPWLDQRLTAVVTT